MHVTTVALGASWCFNQAFGEKLKKLNAILGKNKCESAEYWSFRWSMVRISCKRTKKSRLRSQFFTKTHCMYPWGQTNTITWWPDFFLYRCHEEKVLYTLYILWIIHYIHSLLCCHLYFTWSFFSIGFEGWDDDISDLSHTHSQQALIHALDQPTLAH